MYPIDNKARSFVAVLVTFIAFVWIGCAYIMGPEAQRMLLHPVVPILLILLLFGFRGDDSARRVITIAIVFISIWLFARLQSVFMPFVIGFSLAYVVNVALSGLQRVSIPLPKGRRFHLPKRAAVAMLMVLLIGVLAFFALGIVPQLVAQVGGMKQGITDFYNRAKEYTLDTLEAMQERLLFSIESVPQYITDTLNSNTISEEFLALGDPRIELSPDAVVLTQQPGSEWRITDGSAAYVVRKEGDRLNIYQEREYPFKERLPDSWRNAINGSIDKTNEYLQQKIPAAAKRASESLAGLLAALSAGLIGTMGRIASLFFIFIIFVYALQSFQAHMEKLEELVPENQRRRIVRYAAEIDTNMRSFLRGQLAVIITISIISIIAYSIIQVPFALLVGLLAGLCNAIPTVGPIIGGGIAVLASIVGFVAGSYGLVGFLIQLALVIGVAFGIQLLDNSFISPKIMSRAVEVHPLVVLFAVLLAANFVGIWGAILAIPGIVVFKAVIKVSGEIRAEREAHEAGLDTSI
jgi:predicted PurR-regulated permease PerM